MCNAQIIKRADTHTHRQQKWLWKGKEPRLLLDKTRSIYMVKGKMKSESERDSHYTTHGLATLLCIPRSATLLYPPKEVYR